jgi:N-acylneuraminate cytidylyltransferase/CMP-N,N'-diacetyllegionaminic acid synthase
MMGKKKPYILGIIPARKGSCRLPNKNTKLLCGRPLIDYAIRTALKSGKIDQLIVTTDCEKIKKAAIASGASVPFLRPKKLAKNTSLVEEALRHAVLFMEKLLGQRIDIIVMVQATSPFTTVEIIDNCIELLLKKRHDTVITVERVSRRAEWTGLIDKKGKFKYIINSKERFKLAREKEYMPSGNVYVFKRKVLFGQKKIIVKNTGTIIVPVERAVDIDYLLDFQFAEFLLAKKYIKQAG